MKLRRASSRAIPFLPSALVAVSLLVIGNRLDVLGRDLSGWMLVAVSVGLVLLLVVAGALSSHMFGEERSALITALAKIEATCARSTDEQFQITTIRDFLRNTESHLSDGDEVFVLTHDLECYDCTDPAVATIAANLCDGVRYQYFLPHDPTHVRRQAQRLTEQVVFELEKAGKPPVARQRAVQNLSFNTFRGAALYHFAYFRYARDTPTGYWYLTTPDDRAEDSTLVITSLGQDNRAALFSVFTALAEDSDPVVPEVNRVLH